MALIDKLKAIADGFRSSRGTTQEYTLDEMATLAAEPVSGSGGDSEWEEQFIRCIERDESKPITKLPDGIATINSYAFYENKALAVTSLPDGLTRIGQYAFSGCHRLVLTLLPSNLDSINNNAFYNCVGLTTLTFEGKPSSIGSSAFRYCSSILAINVPWAEGEVANAPWGATNATINYNYTGG